MFKKKTLGKDRQGLKRQIHCNESSASDDEGDAECMNPMNIMQQKKRERALLRHIKKERKTNHKTLDLKPAEYQPMSNNVTREALSVLEKKHDDAMNSFISSRLGNTQSSTLETEIKQVEQKNLGKAEIFSSIAIHAITKGTDAAGREMLPYSNKEADMGSGGNILGGTGIAEVSLERRSSVQQSSFVNDQSGQLSRRDEETMILKSGLPTSFGSSKRKPTASTSGSMTFENITTSAENTLPNCVAEKINVSTRNIPASLSHNYKKHTHDWVIKRLADEEKSKEGTLAAINDNDSSGRIGFTASREVGE